MPVADNKPERREPVANSETKPYIRRMAPERIEFRPRRLRWLALILVWQGLTFWGSIVMMQNPDTLDHVLAVVSLLFGIATLVVIPDLFRSWSFAVTRDGIEVNASLFHRSPRFVPWRDVTGIDAEHPELYRSIFVHVAGGRDVCFLTTEFHRSMAKTLAVLREWRAANRQPWMAEDGVAMPETAFVPGHSDSRMCERVYARYEPE